MVKIKRWIGRTGNNIFQYAAARILANKYGLKLETQWEFPEFIEVYPHTGGEIGSGAEIAITDTRSSNPAVNLLLGDYQGKNITMEGYFQNVEYFNPIRNEIKRWFAPCKLPKNNNDYIIHYRVSDYYARKVESVIHPNWYAKILHRCGYSASMRGRSDVVIVTDDPLDYNVMWLAKQLKAKITKGTPAEDFDLIRSHNKILCSNGSFAWWAAFLSEAEQIFTFSKWMRFHNLNLANMIGATPVQGSFVVDPAKAAVDWDRYWEKK